MASNSLSDNISYSDHATLGLLTELEKSGPVTQRSLSTRLGVALGLTNGIIRRCIKKGLIKVSEAPARRYRYYLTPKGFREKGRLVADYLSTSLSFYRESKEQYAAAFEAIEKCARVNVALFGAGELAEIALLAAQESGVTVQAVIQPGHNMGSFGPIRVIRSFSAEHLAELDVIVITNMDNPQRAYEQALEIVGDDQIYVVPLLHIVRKSRGAQETK